MGLRGREEGPRGPGPFNLCACSGESQSLSLSTAISPAPVILAGVRGVVTFLSSWLPLTSGVRLSLLELLGFIGEGFRSKEESFAPALLQEHFRDTEEQGCGTCDILTTG